MRAGRPRTSSRWNVTDAAVVRPLVRPAFLKWSMVVFVLLVSFVVHAIWDYAESSRLAGNIARIRENHEPLSAYDIEPRPHPLGGGNRLQPSDSMVRRRSSPDRTKTTSAACCPIGLPMPSALAGGLRPCWPTCGAA